MYFLETSAKEADNVERLFYEIAAELIEQARKKEMPRSDTSGAMASNGSGGSGGGQSGSCSIGGGISNLSAKSLGQTNCCGGGGGGDGAS